MNLIEQTPWDIATMKRLAPFLVFSAAVLSGPPVHAKPIQIFDAPYMHSGGVDPPQRLAVGDFDRDGHLDVATASPGNRSSSYAGSVAVFPGHGDGTLCPPMVFGTGQGTSDLVVGDIDGDGLLDIVALNNRSSDATVLIGQGNGFVELGTVPIGANPVWGVLGEVTGDDALDVVAYTSTGIKTLVGDGGGGFVAIDAHELPSGADNYSTYGGDIFLGDMNGDGFLDVAIGKYVLMGNGDGTFYTRQVLEGWPYVLAIGDLDGDEVLDLVAGNGPGVMRGNGDGTFERVLGPSLDFVQSGVLADLNGDGQDDLAVSIDGPEQWDVGFRTYLNSDGILYGVDRPGRRNLQMVGLVRGHLAAGDFDEDGRIDLAACRRDGVMVTLGNGDGTMGRTVQTCCSSQETDVMAVGDVTGDGLSDVVLMYSDSGSPSLFVSRGDGSFEARAVPNMDGASLVIGDMNRDGHRDIISPGGTRLYVSFNDGTGNFSDVWTFFKDGDAVDVGDQNGDGWPDRFVVPDQMRYSLPNGLLGEPIVFSGRGQSIVRADFDGDGLEDEASRYGVGVKVRRGRGAIPDCDDAWVFGGGQSPSAIAIAEVNGDGAADIVVMDGGDGDEGYRAGFTLLLNRNNPPPLRIELELDPARLDADPRSHPAFFTAYLEPEDGTPPDRIDVSSIRLNGVVEVTEPVVIGDHDADGVMDLAVRFDGAEVAGAIDGHGAVEVIVTGDIDDREFAGSDTIEVAIAVWVDIADDVLADAGAGRGVALADIDGDGDLDIYLTNGAPAPNRLFRNDGTDIFTDVTSELTGASASSFGAAFADVDNDEDLDLFISAIGTADRLLRNESAGVFVDAGSLPPDAGLGQGVAFGDVDADGDVDLYVANFGSPNKLYRNDGSGVFVDATAGPLGDTGYGRGVTFGDVDGDGDLDLYLANSGSANKLFRNEGNGVFVDATSGPLGDAGDGMGVAFGDIDNDGDLDLYISNVGPNKLLRNEGAGDFSDITTPPLDDDGSGAGVAFGDLDLDGDLDLYHARFGANRVFRNEGDGVFVDVATGSEADGGPGQGVALGDLDGDGDLDIYLANSGTPNRLLRNERLALGQHWLQVGLIGTVSNRSGIGARVEVVAGGGTQVREITSGSGYLSQQSLTAVFGLGPTTVVDAIVVRWPSGIVQKVTRDPRFEHAERIGVDQVIELHEPEGLWEDITHGAMQLVEPSRGFAFGDADQDGDVDLFQATAYALANRLFRNEGAGQFVDVASGALATPTSTYGTAFGDVDNDGMLDLVFSNDHGGNQVLRNGGGLTFEDVTTAPFGPVQSGFSVVLGDIEGDGYLDIVDSYRLYRNDCNWQFADVSLTHLPGARRRIGGSFGDVDNDGDLDLYLAVDSGPNQLYRNDGFGVFANIATGPLADPRSSFGAAFGDIDNDGDLDLYVAVVHSAGRLLRNEDGNAFTDVTHGPLLDLVDSRGCTFGDIDNDGDLDLYVTVEHAPNRLYLNDGSGSFTDGTGPLLGDKGQAVGAGFADIDADGDLDLYVANGNTSNRLFRNEKAASGNHWLHIDLIGSLSNRAGIGARVRVVAGGLSQIREVSGGSGFASQNSLTAEFGLGDATTIDSILVRWPSGFQQILTHEPDDAQAAIAADQRITITEGHRSDMHWADVTTAALADGANARAVSLADIDDDGDLDFYVANALTANRLLRNEGGGTFVDATSAPLDDSGDATGAAFADLDNDGDLDLFLPSLGDNRYLRNDGGSFVDASDAVLEQAGLDQSVAIADYDLDGDLDLFLAREPVADRLLRNEGDGFVEVTAGAPSDSYSARACLFADLDDDGDADLYLVNVEHNHLFRNDGGTFVDVTNTALFSVHANSGVTAGDIDNDGDLDLYVSKLAAFGALLRNDGGGVFANVTHGPLLGTGPVRSAAFGDVDNDGDLDLYAVSVGANMLFLNNGAGGFANAASGPISDALARVPPGVADAGDGVEASLGDVDGDGDLDLYVANFGGANRLMRNETLAEGRHWLQIRLTGTTSNRSAIGARVVVVTGARRQMREITGGSGRVSHGAPIAAFGLGGAGTVDSLIIRWPSGAVQAMTGIAADQILTLTEGATVSAADQPLLPLRFGLRPSVPNPFSHATTIGFDVPHSTQVSFRIYDVRGREVVALEPGRAFAAGRHQLVWNGTTRGGRRASPGVYFYVMRAGEFRAVKRVVMLR